MIRFIEVDSEIAAGTRGASLGINAMRVAALNKKSDVFSKHPTIKVETFNDLLFQPTAYPHAKRIDGVVKVYERVGKAIQNELKEDIFPVVLAGDHASAGGTIAGIKSAFPNKKLGVVWIDAHGDLHTPYTTPSGNIHGMPLGASLNTDNLDNKVNDLDEATADLWNQMKNAGGIAPKVLAEDIVFIAVRDTEGPEDDLIAKNNIKNFKTEEVREKGAHQIAVETLEKLSDCDILYVSFDVDSMDADLVSYGTGTPVTNGLTPEESKEIIAVLLKDPKTVCFEIVEVNPCLDNKGNKMAETALDVLETAIDILEQKK